MIGDWVAGHWSLVVLAVVLLCVYTSWTAGRLDRLHARVDAAWAALDAALVRRAAAARSVVLHLPPRAPQTAALERATVTALAGSPVDREAVENELTAALRAALPLLPDAGSGAVRAELEQATSRVALARAVHNGAVADTLVLRRRRYPRALRLAGHRALPRHFDIDDAVVPAAGSSAAPRLRETG